MKKHVAIFEEFEIDNSYTEVIGPSEMIRMVDLFNEPSATSGGEDDVKDSEIELYNVTIKFDLDIQYRRSGIDGISFRLRKVTLDGILSSWDDDNEKEFSISDDNVDYERYESEIGNLPFYIDNIEIDMGRSLDPKNFKYLVRIGNQE